MVVMRPILLGLLASCGTSVNHSAPSGPAVIVRGPLFAVGIGNSVTFRDWARTTMHKTGSSAASQRTVLATRLNRTMAPVLIRNTVPSPEREPNMHTSFCPSRIIPGRLSDSRESRRRILHRSLLEINKEELIVPSIARQVGFYGFDCPSNREISDCVR